MDANLQTVLQPPQTVISADILSTGRMHAEQKMTAPG
jgi:hypothetical protein